MSSDDELHAELTRRDFRPPDTRVRYVRVVIVMEAPNEPKWVEIDGVDVFEVGTPATKEVLDTFAEDIAMGLQRVDEEGDEDDQLVSATELFLPRSIDYYVEEFEAPPS